MKRFINRFVKDESGITALETAIILIAFVVVAAVFAFTVLSTGTFLTERSKEAAYSGLQEVRGSMELKGGVTAHSAAGVSIDYVEFTLSTVAGGSSVDLTNTAAGAKVTFTYRDSANNTDLTPDAKATAGAGDWYVTDCQNCDGAADTYIISQGSLATIHAALPAAVTLGPNDTFAIEIKPPTGGTMLIERTVPAKLDTFTDLH